MNKTFPYAYIRKKICPTAKATISIQCKVVQYGLGCFSGIRGNWNSKTKNLYLFRPQDHYKRLRNSAKILGMEFDLTCKKFLETLIRLAKKNRIKEDCYIRPTLYSASTRLTPRFDSGDDDLAMYIISLKDYFNTSKGLNLGVSTWRRYDDDAIPTKSKATGSYVNSALAKSEAISNGYDEPIFLNRDGKICEASGANIFCVKNGEVFTPPLSANNLNGITRETLLEILRNEMNVGVREENIDRSMIYMFDEIFLCGTAAKVSYVRTIDKRLIGNGNKGKITKKLEKIFDEISFGNNENYMKYCFPVY